MSALLPPATRDRLAGRYCGQCPACRCGRAFGPDCAGAGPDTARHRRKIEKRALRRYVAHLSDAERDARR